MRIQETSLTYTLPQGSDLVIPASHLYDLLSKDYRDEGKTVNKAVVNNWVALQYNLDCFQSEFLSYISITTLGRVQFQS